MTSSLTTHSSTSTGFQSNDLSELADILTSNYDEEGVFKASRSVCIRTSGMHGVGFLTPNDMISRVSSFIKRKSEDIGIRNMESFRHISDIVVVIVPQVSHSCDLTLSLVDTAFPLEPIAEQQYTVNSLDGIGILVFDCCHSIPNEDRINLSGNTTHRRLGLMYSIESDLQASGAITTFAITPIWREAHSMRPSFYKRSEPVFYPVTVGYKKGLILKTHSQLKSVMDRGMITTHHQKAQTRLTVDTKFDLTSRNMVSGSVQRPISISDVTEDTDKHTSSDESNAKVIHQRIIKPVRKNV
nr:movememt protein [Vinca ringspot virus]